MSRAEADFLQPVEPFELVREEKDQEAGKTSTIVESSSLNCAGCGIASFADGGSRKTGRSRRQSNRMDGFRSSAAR